MSKVTALKKAGTEPKGSAGDQVKSCRIPNVEIPGEIMLAVQKLVKDKGWTMTKFWKEAANLRLQAEDIRAVEEKLEKLLEQAAYAEHRLKEIEEREQLLHERETRLEEVERSQSALYEERLNEAEKMAGEMEEEYRAKLAALDEAVLKQEEEYRNRLGRIEEDVRERSEEYRRHLDLDYQEKERELIKREARVEVREQIALEKEKFWSNMYEAVVKLTRVCGSLK